MNEISHHKAKGLYESLRFALVNPRERSVRLATASDLYGAMSMVGLGRERIDHGIAIPATKEGGIGFSVVAGERPLFENEGKVNELFAVGKRLYAGPGVIYAHSATVRALDVPDAVPCRFFTSVDDVEAEIAAKTIDRPMLWEGPAVTWQWPQPAPVTPNLA